MLTVYGVGPSPFVRKVRVLLAEKSVPYQLEPVLPMNVSAEFKKISPLGKIPALRDGERTLADSSVICAYLERTHPQPALYPAEPYDQARALWFEEYGDTGMAEVMGPKIFFQKIVGPRFMSQKTDEAVVAKAVAEDLPRIFDYLEGELGTADALVGGQLSIADIGVCTQIVNLRHAGFDVDGARWPKLARYASATLSRPSFTALLGEERAMLGL